MNSQRTTYILMALTLALSLIGQTAQAGKRPARLHAKSAAKQTRDSSNPEPILAPSPSTMKVYVLRLRPGQDLTKQINKFVIANNIRAGVIVSCVGSLRQASLRLANKDDITTYTDKFEIVSLVGTVEPNGGHLHMALSDGTGKTIGGHVEDGNLIYTTAEIIIGDLTALKFVREHDPDSTYEELIIRKR